MTDYSWDLMIVSGGLCIKLKDTEEGNVSVNSKCYHPPGQPLGHLTKIFAWETGI